MITLDTFKEMLQEEEKRLEESYGSSSFVTQNYLQGRIDIIEEIIENLTNPSL